jgi:hypothetical protein
MPHYKNKLYKNESDAGLEKRCNCQVLLRAREYGGINFLQEIEKILVFPEQTFYCRIFLCSG